MNAFRLAVLVLLSTILAACSGGGGGGGPKNSSFRITLDRTSVTIDMTQGGSRPTQTINATTTGTVPDQLYVGAVVEGQGIDPNIQILINGTNATIQFQPQFGLAIGDYSGRILFLACSDQACNNRVGGTPIAVTYLVRVRAPAGISPTSITMNATEGNAATANVTVRLPDDTSTFTANIDGAPEWLTISNQTASGLQLNARALPAGNYSATLRVVSGANTYQAFVSHNVSGGPALALSAVSGQSASGEMSAPLGVGATTYSASVYQGAEWLSITEQLPGVVRVQARSLPASQYAGIIVITSGASTSYRSVQYTVSEPPGGYRNLSVSPANLTLTAAEGATGPAVPLSVVKPSWNPPLQTNVDYYGSATGWLNVTASDEGYDITADASQLAQGSYSAVLSINPGWPSYSVVSVPIALTVGVGFVRPADVIHSVTAQTTAAQLSGSVAIDVVDGPVVNWTASDDASWLTLTRAAGATGTTLQYRIDQAALATLENFKQHSAQITVTPDIATMTPVSFLITLDRQIAEVTGVGPFYLVANQPNKLIIRGGGFLGLNNPATDVEITGASATNMTVVNDTEITADLGPLAPGTHTISIDNALGLPSRSPSFKVLAAQTHSYATAQTGGNLKAFVYDDARQTIFAVNDGLQSLQRFKLNGSTWEVTSLPVPQIVHAGLADFGNSVMVLTANGRIQLIDPESLTVQKTFTPPLYGFASTHYEASIPMTNDGRAFLPTSTATGIVYFSLVTESLGTIETNSYLNFNPGPFYGISGNGERLLVGQTAGGYPMYSMDARNSQLAPNPAGIDYFYDAQLSSDASRVMFNGDRVYDDAFQVIGRVQIPSTTTQYQAQRQLISPDGTRIYVLVADTRDFDYTQAPTTTHPLRVYVFDSSTRMVNQQYLPLLGYFEFSDYAGCRVYYSGCTVQPFGAISVDGRTLLFGGSERVVIVPIPTTLTPFSDSSSGSSGPVGQVQKAGGSFMVKPRRWVIRH